MTATISTWGNSQGLRFPKNIMKELHLTVGDKMKIVIDNNRIILEPVKEPREKYDIDELVRDMPSNYHTREVFADSIGMEEW